MRASKDFRKEHCNSWKLNLLISLHVKFMFYSFILSLNKTYSYQNNFLISALSQSELKLLVDNAILAFSDLDRLCLFLEPGTVGCVKEASFIQVTTKKLVTNRQAFS